MQWFLHFGGYQNHIQKAQAVLQWVQAFVFLSALQVFPYSHKNVRTTDSKAKLATEQIQR